MYSITVWGSPNVVTPCIDLEQAYNVFIAQSQDDYVTLDSDGVPLMVNHWVPSVESRLANIRANIQAYANYPNSTRLDSVMRLIKDLAGV